MGNIECCHDDLNYDGVEQQQKHKHYQLVQHKFNNSRSRKSLKSDYSMCQSTGSVDKEEGGTSNDSRPAEIQSK